MFICDKCGEPKMSYNHQLHQYECKCGHIKQAKPQQERCSRCGHIHTVYAWFDPCSCPKCSRSRDD